MNPETWLTKWNIFDIIKTKKLLNKILAKNTGQSLNKIEKDVERDYYLDSTEAINYGLVDKVL